MGNLLIFPCKTATRYGMLIKKKPNYHKRKTGIFQRGVREMTRKKTQTAGTVVLKCDETLHLPQTLFCGQCFRWQKESEQQFTGIAMGRRLTLTQTEDIILFHDCTDQRFSFGANSTANRHCVLCRYHGRTHH